MPHTTPETGLFPSTDSVETNRDGVNENTGSTNLDILVSAVEYEITNQNHSNIANIVTTPEECVYICETCGMTNEQRGISCDGCGDYHYCSRQCQRQHWENLHRSLCNRCNTHNPARRHFTTPCGQTYWVDHDYWLFTNQRVELPIGYWSVDEQCVCLDHGNDSDEDSDEYSDDDCTPPPSPPPTYQSSGESTCSEGNNPIQDYNEDVGEQIILNQS